MKVETAQIYKCDHCGKVQFRRCDMTKHEKWCKLNPINDHACYKFCKHLVKTEEKYEGQSRYDSGESFTGKKTVFTCGVSGQKMYSFKAEKLKLPILNELGIKRMPIDCNDYKGTDINDDLIW